MSNSFFFADVGTTSTLTDTLKNAITSSQTDIELNDASNFVRVIEERTGLKIACLEEIAFTKSWISISSMLLAIEEMKGSEYGIYLSRIIG